MNIYIYVKLFNCPMCCLEHLAFFLELVSAKSKDSEHKRCETTKRTWPGGLFKILTRLED